MDKKFFKACRALYTEFQEKKKTDGLTEVEERWMTRFMFTKDVQIVLGVIPSDEEDHNERSEIKA